MSKLRFLEKALIVGAILVMMARPVCAQTILLDINGDGQPDEPCDTTIDVGDTLKVDLYLNMSYDTNIIAAEYRFNFSSATCSVVSVEAPRKAGPTYFGPWDTSGANQRGSYYLCSLFENGAGVPAASTIPLHRFVIQCDGPEVCQVDLTGILVMDLNTREYYPSDVGCTITQEGEIPCSCSISPPSATLGDNGTQQFTASQTANCNASEYTWSENCARGNVDASGFFSADASVANQVCTVTAKDMANTDSQGQPVECVAEVTLTTSPDQDADGAPDDEDNSPDDYNPNQTDSDGGGVGDASDVQRTTTPSTTPLPVTTSSISACEEDEDCDDGTFCNGEESCVSGKCRSGDNPCPDDDLFCNGKEICSERNGICQHSGDPCQEGTVCREEDDKCLVQPLPDTTATTHTTSPTTIPATASSVQPPPPDSTSSTTTIDTTTSINPISSSTTSSTSQFWPLLYDEMWGHKKDQNIFILRAFRDEVLINTETGNEYVSMLYDNSFEISILVYQDQSLIAQTGKVVDELLSGIQSIIYKNEIPVSQKTITAVESLLNQLEPNASPKLRMVIKRVRKDIREETVFKYLGIKKLHNTK